MAERLHAGFGKARLKDPVGLEMAGYGYFLNRRCTGVMDHLHVHCVTLRTPKTKAVLISADLIGLRPSLAEEIRKGIERLFGFRQEEILLVCTHTHSGPATNQIVACGTPDEDYCAALPQAFYRAVRTAIKDEKPVFSAADVCQRIEPVGFNRVSFTLTPHDAVVRGVMLYREGGEPVALISYPCHPVTYGRRSLLSADFPGAVCRLCKRRGIRAVFLNGACGDVNPIQNMNPATHGAGTRPKVAGYARRIVDGFEKGLRAVENPTLSTMRFPVSLPLQVMSEDEIEAEAAKAYSPEVAEPWRKMMLSGAQRSEVTVDVQAVRIGDVAFCAVPYEPYTAVGDVMRSVVPGMNAVLLGCADAPKNYLPVMAPGQERGYESGGASILFVEQYFLPEAGERMGRQIGEQLKKWR